MGKEVFLRKETYLPGARVEIVETFDDPYTPLPAGLQGTVKRVDDIGTVHVKWDNGSNLGAALEDFIKII